MNVCEECVLSLGHGGPHQSRRIAVTLKEAAANLGVTSDNLRGAIARGTLKAEKRGRDWFVTSREVERYRTEHRRSVSRVNRAG